jgi:hypothetical protein
VSDGKITNKHSNFFPLFSFENTAPVFTSAQPVTRLPAGLIPGDKVGFFFITLAINT